MHRAKKRLEEFDSKVNGAYERLSYRLPDINEVQKILDKVEQQILELGGTTQPVDAKTQRKQNELKRLQSQITPDLCQESRREFYDELLSYNKAKQVTDLIQFHMDRYYKDPEEVKKAYNEKIEDHVHDFETAKQMFTGLFRFENLISSKIQRARNSCENTTKWLHRQTKTVKSQSPFNREQTT